KLTTKSAPATAETAAQIHPGSPASAIRTTTQSQYCGEKTLLAMKKTQTSAQLALRTSSFLVRNSATASAAAALSVTEAEIRFACFTNPRGSTPARKYRLGSISRMR